MLVLLSLHCNCFRLIEISCICEVFQKLTRAEVLVQIFGHTPVPKARQGKKPKQIMHINY